MTDGADAIVERVMSEVERGLETSLTALDADTGASRVLRAVVDEFQRKFAKTRGAILGADERLSREGLIELEQAADSARYAALADVGADPRTRDLVVDTHDWACTYKVTGHLLRP
jgi:hypothetical protein